MGGFAGPLIGAASSLIGGSKGQKSTSTTTNEPWKELQPYLKELYEGAQTNFQNSGGSYSFYPNPAVAGQSPYTQLGLQHLSARLPTAGVFGQGFGPASDVASSLLAQYNPSMWGWWDVAQGLDNPSSTIPGQAAMGSLLPTAMGQMLHGNPYLDATFENAASAVTDQFSNATMPGLQSMFSAAGRYGPNAAMTTQVDLANQGLGRTLNSLASDIYGGNYARERANQLDASRQLGAFASGDAESMLRGLQGLQTASQYDTQNMMNLLPTLIANANTDVTQMLNLGQLQENYAQRLVDSDRERYDWNTQNAGFLPLQQYAQLLGTNQGMASSNTSSRGPGANPLSSILGGANMGDSVFRNIFGASNPSYALSGAGTGFGGGTSSYGLNPFSGSGLGLNAPSGFDIGGGLGSSLFAF